MKKRFFNSLLMTALAVAVVATSFVSCKDYDDDINDLRDQISGTSTDLTALLQSQAASLQAAYAAADAALQSTLESKMTATEQTAAEAYADVQAAQAQVAAIQAALDLVNSALEDVDLGAIEAKAEEAYELASTLAEGLGSLDDLKALLETLPEDMTLTDVLKQAYENEARIIAIESQLESLLDTNEGAISKLNGRCSELEALVSQNTTDVKDLLEIVQNNSELTATQIDELQTRLESINQYLSLVAKRLKGLVFAPTTYIDGIEAICFASLEYEDWGTALEADAPSTGDKYVIDDAQHTEQYLVNPKNVDLNNISEFSFISNDAANISTRAVGENAPVKVASVEGLKDGVLTLKLTKTSTTKFPDTKSGSTDNFTIVSLKAVLGDDAKTQEELEANEEIAVYSDWARLYESTVTPYIHSATSFGLDASGNLSGEGNHSEPEHYYAFSTIYGAGGTTSSHITTADGNDKYIAQEEYYKSSLDLTSLVMVCDNAGNSLNMANYGLSWEFNIMPYYLENEGSTADATDQAQFAKIADDGKTIYSTARDNSTTENRDAIGRQPVVQVILKDDTNGKVVDVRYLKIKWVDNIIVDTYGSLGSYTDSYTCGGTFDDGDVLEATMNAIYTKYDMTRDEFHAAYTVSTDLYASEAEAKLGSAGTPDPTLGTISDQPDAGGSGQTHNLKWTVDYSANPATQAEYDAGYKTITAWGYFQSNTSSSSRIVFSLTLKVTIPKMQVVYTHNGSMWSSTGARNVNPELETDANYGNSNYTTTMFIGDLLYGYMQNGQTASDVDRLVEATGNNVTSTFVFDDSKLSALGAALGTTGTWAVGTDSNGNSILTYNGETAAMITDDGYIQLYENATFATEGTPSDAAKLLVGHYAPIKLVSEYCDLKDEFENYNVNFLTPLELNDNGVYTVQVQDIVAGGSTSASFYGEIILKEVAAENHRIVYINCASGDYSNYKDENGSAVDYNTCQTLQAWYDVKELTFDKDNIKTNLNTSGGFDSTCKTLLNSLIDGRTGDPMYSVDIDTNNWTVTFNNVHGSAIGQGFAIEIPFTVDTKWQTGMTATLRVEVATGSTVQSKKN